MEEPADLIASAIAALQAQRAVLGDAVVEMTIAPLRERLMAAREREILSEQRLKRVTVLFVDVVGSTRMSERLDPEDVHALIDGALETLTACVTAQRGRVLQYAGDSLLAVFGADQVQEDDAERAVRAGLAIVGESAALAARIEAAHGVAGFGLRAGINTGAVLLGGGVDAQGSIRGITVNIAARLEQTAPVGALRIGHNTYRQVRGLFDVTPQPPIEVKGITEPLRSYLVHAVRPRAFRSENRGVEGIETRMVGRAPEFKRLTDVFETVLEEQTLAQVTVIGDAGLGKSRLVYEFEHWMELRIEPVRLFRGRPQPYGNNLPYGLLHDLLAGRFKISDGDTQAVAQARLAAGLGEVLTERLAEQTALVGRLIGLDFSADPHIAGIAGEARQMRDRAFHALVQYFRLLCRRGASLTVLLLDDLHWADEGSLDFVAHLAKSCHDLPMLIVGLGRATLLERRPLWGSGLDYHDRIELAPLSRRCSRELVDALLGRLQSVPAALRELLTSSAEGNPYYVEELVGMLIDDGVIVTGADQWCVVAEKLLDVRVPASLAGVLQARIDSLPPAEKAALQQASVIGHVFWDEALQRIAPRSADALDGLMRRELARGRETSAFEGAREFVFKHHVLHQVTYDGVLKRDKREHHRHTADWLVLRSGDRASEYFGLIADHYERAGQAERAVVYLQKAGEDAARSYVHAAALDYLGRALALVPVAQMTTRFDLLATRRGVFGSTGQRDAQEADVAALELLADRMGDPAYLARAAGLRASQAIATGDYPAAAAAGARAVAWAEAAGVRTAALAARINWARALQFQGDYAGAQRHVEESLLLAREAGDRGVESRTLLQLGILAFHRGDLGTARRDYQQALDVAVAIGDRAIESAVINNLGDTERLLGNYDAAFDLLLAGQRLCRQIGERTSEGYLLCNMAQVAFLRGDAAGAIGWTDQADEIARLLQDPDLRASLLCTRGHAHAALGRGADAARCYDESLALYRQLGRATMPPEPLAGLARLALGRGDSAAAARFVAEIVAHVDTGGGFDGTEDPMWIYLTCHDVLEAAGDVRAGDWLRTGHALLLQRAAPLADGERETFLTHVPSNRALVAAARARGISSAPDRLDAANVAG